MDHLSAAASSGSAKPKLLRYALRSATKLKEDKPVAHDCPNSSHSNKSFSGRIAVSVIDLSGKEKSGSAKPPRRVSIPEKKSITSAPKPAFGSITPISETRTRRPSNVQGKSETPISEISKISARTRLNLITSASYWLNQIKLSEFAAKHSVSLGFFKLALEAGCEPLQRMQEGLRTYVKRNDLADFGETVKELFEIYAISVENTEQPQVSETISQVPEDGTRSSDDDDDVHSSSSSMGDIKLKPKCLNIDTTPLTPAPAAAESTKKESTQKGNPRSRLLSNLSTNNSPKSRPASESGNRNRLVKKAEIPNKKELEGKEKRAMVKRQGKKSDAKAKEVLVSNPKGNKENKEARNNEENNITEFIV